MLFQMLHFTTSCWTCCCWTTNVTVKKKRKNKHCFYIKNIIHNFQVKKKIQKLILCRKYHPLILQKQVRNIETQAETSTSQKKKKGKTQHEDMIYSAHLTTLGTSMVSVGSSFLGSELPKSLLNQLLPVFVVLQHSFRQFNNIH